MRFILETTGHNSYRPLKYSRFLRSIVVPRAHVSPTGLHQNLHPSRESCHHAGAGRGAAYSPSVYCSRTRYGHPQAAFPRRSSVAGLVGCLPYLSINVSDFCGISVGFPCVRTLNLGLDVVDGVGGLDFESDGLACERLDEDLHSTTKAEDEMECRLLLNVVIRQRATVLKLLASEDETLLVWRNALLVLNLRLHIVDGVRALDLKGDGLAGNCERRSVYAYHARWRSGQAGYLTSLDEDLHVDCVCCGLLG